jgi:hypothetical protein
MSSWDESVAHFDALLERFPTMKRKGKTMPYTSMNGHMFSFVDKEGVLGLRMSKEDIAEFRAQYGTGDFIQYNSVMRGYVVVPADLLADTDTLVGWYERSLAYIGSLKPKPTKR